MKLVNLDTQTIKRDLIALGYTPSVVKATHGAIHVHLRSRDHNKALVYFNNNNIRRFTPIEGVKTPTYVNQHSFTYLYQVGA